MPKTREIPSGRSLRLLRMLLQKGKPATVYTIRIKQSELAKQLGISRQALNVHLRKLRDLGCVRTGRGFIDITEEGLNILGYQPIQHLYLLKSRLIKEEKPTRR